MTGHIKKNHISISCENKKSHRTDFVRTSGCMITVPEVSLGLKTTYKDIQEKTQYITGVMLGSYAFLVGYMISVIASLSSARL